MANARGSSRLILPDMNGVVDPRSKVVPVQTRSGFAIYFSEDPAEQSSTGVSFQHKTSKRRTSSGNAFYGVLVLAAIAALITGFVTGVIDLDGLRSSTEKAAESNGFLREAQGFLTNPEYLPMINIGLMIFVGVVSLGNFSFLLVQRFIGTISILQTLAFSILTLSVPTCMFVIGIWAATI